MMVDQAQPVMQQPMMQAQPMMQGQPMMQDQPMTMQQTNINVNMNGGMQQVHQAHLAPGVPMGGLFDCFGEMETCCCGYWCTWCLAGQTHERAGLPSGPMFKIPAICCVSTACSIILGAIGIGAIFGTCGQCYAFKLIIDGRGEIQKLAGQPNAGCVTNCCTYCLCPACAACQVRLPPPCPGSRRLMQ